jgi:histone H3/H4
MPKLGRSVVGTGRPAKDADPKLAVKEVLTSTPQIKLTPQKTKRVEKEPPATQEAPVAVKKAYRLHPGTKALRDMAKQQKKTNNCIPRTRVYRMCKNILAKEAAKLQTDNEHSVHKILMAREAVATLHDTCEAYMINLLNNSTRVSTGADSVTLMYWHLTVTNAIAQSVRNEFQSAS